MKRTMLLAEQLVGQARVRRTRGMSVPERLLTSIGAGLFLLAAAAIAWLVPDERVVDPLVLAGLLAGYIAVSRIRFEFASIFTTPEQLALVPLLLLAPLPLVPFLVATCALASQLPDLSSGGWSRERWMSAVADSWFCILPVALLAFLAPGEPGWSHSWVYIAVLAAQLLSDLAWATVRERVVDRLPYKHLVPFQEIWRNWFRAAQIDALLAPVALVVTVSAVDTPLLLLTLAPFALILQVFSEDRRERFGQTLELQRAYRGTVTLLADVVEFDDSYTAEHSKSVVELVNVVADQLKIEPAQRQELEFAALLHDIGKIAVPKTILHKPSRLTRNEFEVMQRHTIEGQSMLDRVGGLLGQVGEIVRSCHERWDGTGYPDELAGEQIPLAARIVFACDAYNAMTTDRIYRPRMKPQEAIDELQANVGTQFDPAVVAALIDVVEVERPGPISAPADEIRGLLAERPAGDHLGGATTL